MSELESRKHPETWFAGCRTADLPIYLLGAESDAIALYEQLISDCIGVYFRYLDEFGDPVIVPAPKNCVAQIGFDDDDALFPNDNRIFRGFDFLREYFMFPRKFLGFKLTGLSAIDAEAEGEIGRRAVRFRRSDREAAAAVQPAMFALYAAPAINLFEKTTDRIPIKVEFSRISRRSRPQPLSRLRTAPDLGCLRPLCRRTRQGAGAAALLGFDRRHSGRSGRRRASSTRCVGCRGGAPSEERRYGASSDYTGTDMFISFGEEGESDDQGATPVELSVRTLCSNRHLTEHLPVGEGGADFRLLDDVTLDVDLRRRSDAAARAGGVATCAPAARPPIRAPSPGGSSTC